MEEVLLKYLTNYKRPSEKYQRMKDHVRASIYHDIMVGNVDALEVEFPVLATIVTMANRQVKGDELIKGLKAMEFRLPIGIKFTKLYTGGWIITQSDEEGKRIVLSVEAVMKYLNDRYK